MNRARLTADLQSVVCGLLHSLNLGVFKWVDGTRWQHSREITSSSWCPSQRHQRLLLKQTLIKDEEKGGGCPQRSSRRLFWWKGVMATETCCCQDSIVWRTSWQSSGSSERGFYSLCCSAHQLYVSLSLSLSRGRKRQFSLCFHHLHSSTHFMARLLWNIPDKRHKYYLKKKPEYSENEHSDKLSFHSFIFLKRGAAATGALLVATFCRKHRQKSVRNFLFFF